MNDIIDITVTPEMATATEKVRQAVAQALCIAENKIISMKIVRRSIDARRGQPMMQLKIAIDIGNETDDSIKQPSARRFDYQYVANKPPIIIAGAGPAGLFAALRLLECGLRPVILERGKDVSARKYDVAKLTREHLVNSDSNLCFGEGGAGTFSDGKLYTRSNKRGNVFDILQQLINHGAYSDIMVDAHAHIGTDKLPAIIAAIRQTIVTHGGEYHFNTCINGLIVKNGMVQGVIDTKGTKYEGLAVILATGHSACDIYELFANNGWQLESKPFAMGVRAEHPQNLINEIQYGAYYSKMLCRHAGEPRHPILPPATYNLTTQVANRGVFSFCMCPGGIVVPAATSADVVVVNGMSNSQRSSPYANSGIAVQVTENDYRQFAMHGALAGLHFRRQIEQMMYIAANCSQAVPAQRLMDFIDNKNSSRLIKTSCMSGITAAPLHKLLPAFIVRSLQQAFRHFDTKMRGYLCADAMLMAVESRTSSPVRIPRDVATLQHVQLTRLYPCGEGAGYAGGITSSAMDGVRCAEAINVLYGQDYHLN